MNKNDTNNNRPGLKVFDSFAPDKEALHPGYAYLIRSSVRMPELYPLLGELLFTSSVVKKNTPDKWTEEGDPPNVIGMFIEDSPDNLIQHLQGPDFYTSISDITKGYGESLSNDENHRMAAWLDTFGSFHDAGGELKPIFSEKGEARQDEKYKWWRKSIAGPGNPMAIMRFFRQVQEKQCGAGLNVFLLNSLSNLYRNLGLSESAAFLKTMLNKSIWSVEPEPGTESNKQKIRYKSGLFFAVLQEGVLDKQEASYLESFFDGIVKVKPCIKNECRVARVHVEVLPELIQSQHGKDFIYLPSWQFPVNNNDKWGSGWKEERYIRTQVADECIDLRGQ